MFGIIARLTNRTATALRHDGGCAGEDAGARYTAQEYECSRCGSGYEWRNTTEGYQLGLTWSDWPADTCPCVARKRGKVIVTVRCMLCHERVA